MLFWAALTELEMQKIQGGSANQAMTSLGSNPLHEEKGGWQTNPEGGG